MAREFDIFRRILWVKSVSGEEDVTAYSPEDTTSLARIPRREGDRFDLHATENDAFTLEDPAVGDLIALTQHTLLTHLVEVTGAGITKRPPNTVRPNTRDDRFPVQREVELVVMLTLDVAPAIAVAFGFDPRATGGEVFSIPDLPAFQEHGAPLWLVQRRIAHTMLAEQRPGFRTKR